MYRVWYSTESFADYIIDHTILSGLALTKRKMFESDANNPTRFHTMPDHIRKILYLDAPDLIVEKDNEPVFSIEVTTEAGTGHNAFQRFARLAAAVENSVPAFYIYPEGKIIKRKNRATGLDFYKWDTLNPLVFRSLEAVMSLYSIPALLYYFPTDNIAATADDATRAPHFADKGLRFDTDIINYSGCPDSSAVSMQQMFEALDCILNATESMGVIPARNTLLRTTTIRDQRNYMQAQFVTKAGTRTEDQMSPLSAVTKVPTEYLLNYLHQYETPTYSIGELLRARNETALYQVNADFRGDPYPGCLAAIDYLKCRNGLTYEDRDLNLVMVWGVATIDHENRTLVIRDEKGSDINDFFSAVQSCSSKNLLVKNYADLDCSEIPRYLMQVRYGSTYSKVKHIRVFSYFADAILFPNGSLWRDA